MVAEETVSSDNSSICSCDLGLGFGLKPGGLPKMESLDFGFFDSLQSPPGASESSGSPVRTKGVTKTLFEDENCTGCVKLTCATCRTRQGTSGNNLKENFRSKISHWASPKRRLSLILRRTNSDSAAQDQEKFYRTNKDGLLRRVHSVRGGFENNRMLQTTN